MTNRFSVLQQHYLNKIVSTVQLFHHKDTYTILQACQFSGSSGEEYILLQCPTRGGEDGEKDKDKERDKEICIINRGVYVSTYKSGSK